MSLRKFNPLYVGIYLYFINMMLFSYSAIEIPMKGTISQAVNYIVVLLLLLGFIIRKVNSMSRLQFYFLLLGVTLAYLCEYQVNSNLNLLIVLLVGISVWNFDELDYIISKVYKILVIIAILLILMYCLGLVGHYYGFWAKNSLGVILFTILGMKLYLKDFYFYSIKEKVVWIVIGIAILLLVESRTAAICCLLMIALAFIISTIYRERMRKAFGTILCVLSCMVVLLYFFSVNNYIEMPKEYEWLNELFSGRLEMIDYYLSEYNITPFGKYLIHHNGLSNNIQYRYLDSSYFYVLLSYGAVFTVVIVLIYVFMIYHAIKRDKINCVCCLCVNLLYGISELNLISGCTNFALFAVLLLLKEEKIEECKYTNL